MININEITIQTAYSTVDESYENAETRTFGPTYIRRAVRALGRRATVETIANYIAFWIYVGEDVDSFQIDSVIVLNFN